MPKYLRKLLLLLLRVGGGGRLRRRWYTSEDIREIAREVIRVYLIFSIDRSIFLVLNLPGAPAFTLLAI